VPALPSSFTALSAAAARQDHQEKVPEGHGLPITASSRSSAITASEGGALVASAADSGCCCSCEDGPEPTRAWHKQGSIVRDERPPHLEYAPFKHRNALMFAPEAPAKQYEFGPGPKPAVSHPNTRFSSSSGASAADEVAAAAKAVEESGAVPALLDAAAGHAAILRLAAATDHGGAKPAVDLQRGYSLVATPSPSMGGGTDRASSPAAGPPASVASASPLITWGALLGTPSRLNEEEYGSAARLSQPFKVPTLPPRDAKLHSLAADAGQRLRARTPKSAGSSRGEGARSGVPGGLVPNAGGALRTPGGRHGGGGNGGGSTPQLSAAASRMARSLSALTGTASADTALRQSYAPKPTPRPTPRATPRATPRPTPTPGSAVAATQSIRPSPLLLRDPLGGAAGAGSRGGARHAEVGGGTSAAALTDGLLSLQP
jgi:hypothetical protein